jgi:small GTP-binding protein
MTSLNDWTNNLNRIWQRVRGSLPGLRSANDPTATEAPPADEHHLLRAAATLRELLDDSAIPAEVRAALESDYQQVEAMRDKLEHGDLHIAAFGRVSTGKSSLLNALIGEQRFTVSPLHGETRNTGIESWRECTAGGVHLIDTPGIDELHGEQRELAAFEAAQRCDLVLFVTDSDLTDTEVGAMRQLAERDRPVILVLNKADRYSSKDVDILLSALREHARDIVSPMNVVAVSADPRGQTVIRIGPDGSETESLQERPVEISALTDRIWDILENEGKTLAALNAALFAGRLSDEIAGRITQVRKELAERVTRTYSLAKGVAVAVNPVPVADLLAAAGIDVALVSHLSRIYGLPMGRRESGQLLATIVVQLAALMGAVWGVHLVSAALKTATGGLSVAVTAGAQGALAYYATFLVGRAAEQYLRRGKSWGDDGPKRVVEEILESVDRDSILMQARADILERMRKD